MVKHNVKVRQPASTVLLRMRNLIRRKCAMGARAKMQKRAVAFSVAEWRSARKIYRARLSCISAEVVVE